MDHQTFDRLVAAAARRPTRRTALRLLAAGALGTLLPGGAARVLAAQRSDRDGDGLFDDDEVQVYGTNPDVYDTDGDGSGDGEEVYYGTDPLDGGAGQPAPTVCNGIGADCSGGGACCAGLACCFTQVVQRDVCTDIYATGGVCPDFPCPVGTRRCQGDYFCRSYNEVCPYGT
jgi:hypothetical protein